MSDKPDLLEALRGELTSIVRRELAAHRSETADWYDQDTSPLGKSQHLRLVRAGKLKGYKVGKRVLVKRIDVDDYIALHPVARAVAANSQSQHGNTSEDEIDHMHAVNDDAASSGVADPRMKPDWLKSNRHPTEDEARQWLASVQARGQLGIILYGPDKVRVAYEDPVDDASTYEPMFQGGVFYGYK